MTPNTSQEQMINKLIETNIFMQHKMTDMLISMKELNTNVSNLVRLFSDAAAHIKAGKYEDPLVEKLNGLLDQNKNLAKGLILLEKYVREKSTPFQHSSDQF